MTIHNTARILGMLGDAIEKLRLEADDINDYYGGTGTVWSDHVREVADDLALLHAAVSAEWDATATG